MIHFDNFFNKLELYNVMTCKIVLEVVLMLNVLLTSKSFMIHSGKSWYSSFLIYIY
jgi:hypothetical protein